MPAHLSKAGRTLAEVLTVGSAGVSGEAGAAEEAVVADNEKACN